MHRPVLQSRSRGVQEFSCDAKMVREKRVKSCEHILVWRLFGQMVWLSSGSRFVAGRELLCLTDEFRNVSGCHERVQVFELFVTEFPPSNSTKFGDGLVVEPLPAAP